MIMMMMGWTEEKEREGRSGMDGWMGSVDIEKEKEKKERKEKKGKKKEKRRWLEQPHARTHDDCMIDCMNDEQDSFRR